MLKGVITIGRVTALPFMFLYWSILAVVHTVTLMAGLLLYFMLFIIFFLGMEEDSNKGKNDEEFAAKTMDKSLKGFCYLFKSIIQYFNNI